jgi:endonuclease/exonuclease/phosphatase family metal-dependent hydrolase
MIVATYNLWGFGEPWRYTVERGIARGAVPGSRAATERPPEGVWARRRRLLAEVLSRAAMDLVALQEVCVDPSDGRSQAEQLAGDLGSGHAFLPLTDIDYGGAVYRSGLAVLSRFPVQKFAQIPLPGPEGLQQHAAHAVVTAPAGPFDLLVIHLTPRSDTAQLAAIEQLRTYLDCLTSERPRVVAGDFNCTPGSAPIQALSGASPPLRDGWAEVRPDDAGFTMPAEGPVVRIDYLFLSRHLEATAASVLGGVPDANGFYPSDHRGVAVTVRDAASAGTK